ncbi:MAG: site-specific DNA-methyltransferase [Patescibacteria group bacterium]
MEYSNDFHIQYQGKKSLQEILQGVSFKKPSVAGEYNNRLFQQGSFLNKLFWGENLEALKYLLEVENLKGKIKLIYIDPPFSTKQSFKNSDDDHAYDDLLSGAEYLEFIRERLLLLKELLSREGSIYVHLDGKMAFPIKLLMDEIFGQKNFRNWITRKKSSYKNSTSKKYGNIQDFILFYSVSDKYTWNKPYQKNGTTYSFEERFPKIEAETGRRYALVPIHAQGIRNGETGTEWKGSLPPKGKHWQLKPSKLDDLERRGEIHWSKTGNPRRKIYADQDKGVIAQDIWVDFPDAINQNTVITGYPTEKNPDLLKRIISTSSNQGDIVLDCFCGSGTTVSVADQLGRSWIGIDSGKVAIDTTTKRLSGKIKRDPHYEEPSSFSVYKF